MLREGRMGGVSVTRAPQVIVVNVSGPAEHMLTSVWMVHRLLAVHT